MNHAAASSLKQDIDNVRGEEASTSGGNNSQQQLPPGWTAYVDDASGKTYYHNASTQQTQWEKPSLAPPSSMLVEQKEVAPLMDLGDCSSSATATAVSPAAARDASQTDLLLGLDSAVSQPSSAPAPMLDLFADLQLGGSSCTSPFPTSAANVAAGKPASIPEPADLLG